MGELFSIATPVLDGMPYLAGCVGSVRGQAGVRTEHLIVDAGSKDGTSEWLTNHPGPIVVTGDDEGMYDAIERAWTSASGSVLSWLNCDEQYLPGALRAVEEVFAHQPDVDIVSGDAIIVSPSGEPMAARREVPLRLSYLRNGPLYTLSCSLFFRRRLLDQCLLDFDPSLRYAADYDLLLGLLEAGRHTVHLRQYLSLFTAHDRNLSLHPGMVEEIELVRGRRGISGRQMVRRAWLAGRHIEKLRNGCYRREDLAYAYALDQVPNYLNVTRRLVGSRFTWKATASSRTRATAAPP